jgi:Cd2+/Zn2+-exporting ATPase
MNSPPSVKQRNETGDAKCFARSVVDALAKEPTLEAVTIDREGRTISVATLGKSNAEQLSERLTANLQKAQAATDAPACALLSGAGDCHSCEVPLSSGQDKGITIQHQGKQTTIARVTCPTAPTFWRWHRIPFPRVVQRDVEFLEHAEHIEEWKPQLVAAILCGVFGLAGYFLHGSPLSLASYALAYLAGSWFTAGEVWERLRQGAIDVHFLMLAVATGSASIGAWGEGTMLLFLFSLSGALEHFALGRTQREIRSLFREAPKVATVVDEGGVEREMPVEQLRQGLRLQIGRAHV